MLDLPFATPEPYESASALRAANAALLERVDRQLAGDRRPEREAGALNELQPAVREFLARGAATGAYLDDEQERTACQALLDYWTSSLAHAGVLLARARLAGFDAERLPQLDDVARPFVGLDPFDLATCRYFFGRERATRELLARVESVPLVVVQGASGSGKSSLVRGGVLPVLCAADHEPRYAVVGPFMPGVVPLDRLLAELGRALPAVGMPPSLASDLRREPGRIGTLLSTAPPLLVVIDQFEEVFTLTRKEELQTFAAALAALLRARPVHRVLLTLREEFSPQLDTLVPLRPLLEGARFSMSAWPMGYEDLKAAVERPAAMANLHFQPGIVDDIVQGVTASGDTALPLLQFALQELWRLRDRNRITWEVYDKIGRSPLEALKRHADGIYKPLADELKLEVRRILLELVRVDRLLESYRQPVLRSQLLAAGSARTERVLTLLAQREFVRETPTADGRDAVVEVKHESLLRNWPEYIGWINEKREQVRRRIAVSEAAQRWALAGHSPRQGLLTAWQLAEARALGELQGVEAEFVAASERAVRRQSTWSVARYVLATLIVMLAAWVGLESRDARRNEARQDLREQMAAAKEASIGGHLGHALARAVASAQGAQQQPSDEEAGRVLRFEALATLLAVHARSSDLDRLFIDEGAVYRAAAFQPGRERPVLAFAGSAGVVHLSTPGVTALERELQACDSGPVTALAFDPAGSRLAAGCSDGTVSLWSTADWAPLVDKPLPLLDRTIWTIAFSRDGRLLAAAGFENRVRLWTPSEARGAAASPADATGAQPQGSVWSLAFHPAADVLLVGDGAGRLLRCAPAAGADWECAEAVARQDEGALASADAIRSLAFSADGGSVAVGYWRGDVELWDGGLSLGSRRLVPALDQAGGPVFSLAFFRHCNANYLAIAKGAGLQYRPAARASEGCARLGAPSVGDEVSQVTADPGSGLLAAATRSGYVAVLDPTRPVERLRTAVRVPTAPNEQVRGAILADQAGSVRIAVAAHPVAADVPSITVLAFERRDGAFVETARAGQLVGEGQVRRLAASLQARRLATLAWLQPDAASERQKQPTVKVWSFDDRGRIEARPVATLGAVDFDGQLPRRLALSPDGRWLVLSFTAGRVLLLEAGRGPQGNWIDTGLARVREIAFSTDGRFFAAGGDRSEGSTAAGEVRAWRVAPAGLERIDLPSLRLTPLAHLVQEVAFAIEGQPSRLPALLPERRVGLLISAGEYGEIDVWDLNRGGSRPPRRLDSQPVWLLAFDPQRSILAGADSQFRVRLWDTDRRESEPIQLSRPGERGGLPGLLAFGPRGDWLVGGAWQPDSGGELQLWDVDLASLQAKACALLQLPPAATGEPDRLASVRRACAPQ